MPDSLGFSVYLTTFRRQWPTLQRWAGTGAPVFLSLHIGEEAGSVRLAEEVCGLLSQNSFRIIADVSPKTCELFGEPDLIRLALRLSLWALRIDYGFTREEIGDMAEKMPIVLNASTTSYEDALYIRSRGREVFALHNFYPRPETGLDRALLRSTTDTLRSAGLRVLGFLPGDTEKRGPVYEGLPTLEEHRKVLPSAAFVDLALNFGIRESFVGDPGISTAEQDRIARFCKENVISIPARLDPGYEALYGRVYTCRVDSPKWTVRFAESRTYACPGISVEPGPVLPRPRGTITMDNAAYGRYSGELQLLREDRKADDRVNVIGSVPEKALLLTDCLRGGQKFVLVPDSSIRLIAMDLDGTALQNDHKTLSPRLLEALEAAHRKGVIIVPVTGRPHTLMPLTAPWLRWAVLGNGNQIRNMASGEILRRLCIPEQAQTALLELAEELDLPLEFSVDGKLYLTRKSLDAQAAWPGSSFHVDTVLKGHGVLVDSLRNRSAAFHAAVDKINLNCVPAALRPRVTEAVKALGLSGVWTSPPHMEITHRDATKGSALAWLCARLDIPLSAVLALGDSENDISMLVSAGFGVAMGNAPQSVRDRADAVTAPNTEDGAAKAIEYCIL